MSNMYISNSLRGLATASVFLMCLSSCGSKSDISSSNENPAITPVTTNEEEKIKDEVIATQEETVEYKVAAIDAGGYIAKDDITITRARYLINSIQSATNISAEGIGNMAAKASDLIKEKYGKKVSILEILEAINASEEIHNRSMKLPDFLAMYIVIIGS